MAELLVQEGDGVAAGDVLLVLETEDLERAGAFIQKVLKEGTGTIELELICKDGRKVPTEYVVSAIKDEKGEPRYFISIGRDITERKLAEEALRKSEEAYRTLIESSHEVIFSKDCDGRYHSLNLNAALGLGGTCIEDVTGKTDYDLLPREQAAALQETDKEVMESGKIIEAEEVVTNAQGQERIYLSRKWPTYEGEGRKPGIGCLAIDITER